MSGKAIKFIGIALAGVGIVLAAIGTYSSTVFAGYVVMIFVGAVVIAVGERIEKRQSQ